MKNLNIFSNNKKQKKVSKQDKEKYKIIKTKRKIIITNSDGEYKGPKNSNIILHKW